MNITDLLKRTNLEISFEKYLEIIQNSFPLVGIVQSYSPILEGYEDANFLINTSNGKYVLKIFSKDRTERNVNDYIKVIEEATSIGVQTLELVTNREGNLFSYKNTYAIITKYFDGQSYQDIKPSLDDMLLVTENISKLNILCFDIEESYDSWGNKNLVREYESTNVKNKNVAEEIFPLVEFLRKQKLSRFSKGVIHGDMQRKHVIKNNNEICIIDYGCMSYDLKIYDLSTFLAWFCLSEDTWEDKENIFSKVIEKYTELNELSNKEIKLIKPLIAGSYASYFIKTTKLIENGDSSKETLDWNNASRDMFRKSMKWIN